MRINKSLNPEEQRLLEKLGVVFNEDGPHFAKKEKPVLAGTIRLPSGKTVPFKPIEECLKW